MYVFKTSSPRSRANRRLVYTEAPGHQCGVAARPRPGRKESKKEGARERERERVSTVLGRWKLNCEKVAVESL